MRAWSSLAAFGVALLGVSVTTSCQNLEPIEGGCGNLVVEAGEDCDGTFASVANGAACGEPGQENECRFTCSEEMAVCPSGFSCDREEGVCRKPRGFFSAAATALPGSTEPLLAADLDQDDAGASELVISSPSTLTTVYFDEDLQVQQSLETTVRSRDAVAGLLEASGRTDVALLIDGSGEDVEGYMAVLETKSDGTFLPRSFSAAELNFSDLTTNSRFETVEVSFGETVVKIDANGLTILGPDFEPVELYPPSEIPPGNKFAGIAFGNPVPKFNDCDFAAVAREGDAEVTLLPLCSYVDENGDELGPRLPIRVALPPGAQVAPSTGAENAVIQSRVRWGDADNDDVDDLVVQAVCDGDPCILLAYGLGDDALFPPPPVAPRVLVSPDALDPDNPSPQPMFNELADILAVIESEACEDDLGFVSGELLGLGDFNGDDNADIVTRRGVFLSVFADYVDGLFTITYEHESCVGEEESPLTGYREVEVEDVNDDGAVDMIVRQLTQGAGAMADAEPSLRLFLNDGDGFFALYPLADRSSFFEVEDLDGDGLDDIISYARLQPGNVPQGTPTTYQGQVSFGRSSAGPEPAVDIGEFDGIVDLISGQFVGNDAPNDVLVVRQVEEEAVETSILFGSTSRLLVAPYLFLEDGVRDPLEALRPLTLTVGNFGGEGSSLAVLTQGRESAYVLWTLKITGAGVTRTSTPFDLTDFNVDVVDPPDLTGLELRDGLAVAFNLDEDPNDEVFVVTPTGLAVFDVDQDGATPQIAFQFSEPMEGQTRRLTGRPVTRDLDGDGRTDLVVSLGPYEAFVIWNDPNLDGENSIGFIEIPTAGQEDLRDPAVFAALDLDGSGPDDLVVANRTGVWRIPMQGRVIQPAIRLPGIEGGNTLAAADFNGDGLDDLAVGDASTTRVFEAVDTPGVEAVGIALESSQASPSDEAP